MSLTWRDAVTTIIAAGAVIIAVAAMREWNVPIIGNPRWAALVLIVLGIALCIIGNTATQTNTSNPYVMLMAILGGGVILLAVLALIIGTAIYVGITAVLIGLMWLVSTIRHLIS